MVQVPAAPVVSLALAITGHHESNAAFAANRAAIAAELQALLERIDDAAGRECEGLGEPGPTRLHALAAEGTHHIALALGEARGWDLVVPLPFGRAFNLALNAHPETLADAEALFGGGGRPFRSLVTRYQTPEEFAEGSGKAVLDAARTLPGGDAAMPVRIEREVLRRFA